jgi:hypothetical protein
VRISGLPETGAIGVILPDAPPQAAKKARAASTSPRANKATRKARTPPAEGTCIKRKGSSDLEMLFLLAFRLYCPDLPEPKQNYVYSTRGFDADFAWVDGPVKLVLEVEGGAFSHGKHGRGPGIAIDAEKSRYATANGFRLFRVTAACLGSEAKRAEVCLLLRQALGYKIT